VNEPDLPVNPADGTAGVPIGVHRAGNDSGRSPSKWALLALCALVYALFNYGGMRSPDSETVFRVTLSLLERGTFEDTRDLEGWPAGFGTAVGQDRRSYSVYGPGQSLFLVPVAAAGRWFQQILPWYRWLAPPLSHFTDYGLRDFLDRRYPPDPAPHALRCFVSWVELLVSLACVHAFWQIMARLLPGEGRAVFVTVLACALGTFMVSYAGACFSEPLALLLTMWSFYLLLPAGLADAPGSGGAAWRLVLAGLLLGIALSVHLTAVLFVPFFAGWIAWNQWRTNRRLAPSLRAVLLFGAGYALPAAALGYFNYARFGSPLNTGRELSNFNKVLFFYPWQEHFWRNCYLILLGSAKGLLWTAPLVILGICCWRFLHRCQPALSVALAAALIFRVGYAAAYFEWHGGFCLGPRYLYMGLPFFLIPVGFWLAARRREEHPQPAWLPWVLAAGVVQQLYFALGEIFSFYHILNFEHLARGIFLLPDDSLYVRWDLSPLWKLLEYRRGPWLLQWLDVNNYMLLCCLAALVFLVTLKGQVSGKVPRRQIPS